MEQAYHIKRISLVNVSAFLIYNKDSALLVDSGSKGQAEKVMDVMKRVGLEPEMLKLVILTHAHFDHAGSAAKIKELTGCSIMIHYLEEERLKKGFARIPAGTRWKAKLLVTAGRIFARRMGRFPGVEPDVLVQNELDLQTYGFPGRVIHTPGHTIGSMVVFLEGGALISGDTLFGLNGKQHFPPFAEDLPALVRSWQFLKTLQVHTFYPAHGLHFSADGFLGEFDQAMKRYG